MSKLIIKEGVDIEEMIKILYYLRQYEKHWQQNGGFETRKNMRYWQEKADKLIEKSIIKTEK
jgi:hypothetical protein